MNVIDYIKRYGDKTFDEKKFNEVDSLIFSLLSYVEYNGIVSKNFFNKRTIEEVGIDYFSINDKRKLKKKFVSNKMGIEILKNIYNKKRYKDLLMFNDVYISDEKQQFSAVSIELEPGLVFVSFEGTDYQISGWEEDFCMVYQFPVLSQKRAINYVNRHFTISNRKLIFGGHSKGGNLAVVASMYCNFIVRGKIINIYNNDGPGLRKKQLESRNYSLIHDRLIHIIPNYTVVGLLLRHKENYRVIKSNRRSILSHAVVTWEVEDNHFKEAKLSTFSKILDEGMIKWLDNYDDKQREKFVTSLFDIFRNADIHNLLEIMNNKRVILKLIRESSNMDVETRKMILEFIPYMFKYYGEYQLDKIKDAINVDN